MQTTDSAPPTAPAPNPKFIVDDSPLKASIITILSLMFFGVTLAGAVLRLADAHDLNGIRALLMRDDVIGWFTTVATLLAPPFWLAWRSVRSWFTKQRDIEIVKDSSNETAMLKSEVVAAQASELPPTRARVTETATRLVDGAVLLHRGGYAGPSGSPGTPPAGRLKTPPAADDSASVQDLMEKALPAEGTPAAARPSVKSKIVDFDAMYTAWAQAGFVGDFPSYLEEHGWVYADGSWSMPEGEK